MVRRRLLNEEERHYGGPNETYMGKADEKTGNPCNNATQRTDVGIYIKFSRK